MEIIGENIDRLTLLELRPKNFPTRGLVTKLYESARKKVDGPLSLLAAEKLMEATKTNSNVILITGFAVPPIMPINETDGPLGAASLARAINFGLEGKTLILSDEKGLKMIEAICRAAELRVVDKEVFGAIPQSTAVEEFPLTTDKGSKEKSKEILDEINPAAIVSVERAGRNEKNVYHTAFGHDMSGWTAKIDYLIDEARKRDILTIGIGDWGNEAGLGAIRDEVKKLMPYGEKCRCPCKGGTATAVEAEIPVVSICSNLGAYGITACLSALTQKTEILQDAEVERHMIRESLRMGGMDGVQATSSWKMPVDAIPIDAYLSVLTILKSLVRQGLTDVPTREKVE